MVDDHSKANDELKQIAQKENRSLPGEPSPDEQKSAQKLEQMQGAQFDETYAHMMVKDHEQDVALFKQEAQSGKDPQLKEFAQKTLPTLEEHLRMAKQLPHNGNKSG